MGLEPATYNITFKLISGARNKAADCLCRLVKLPNNIKGTVRMLTATNFDRAAFSARGQISQQCQTTKDKRPSNTPSILKPPTSDFTTLENTQDITLKPLTVNRHKALLQMQRIDPFCKHISKRLCNGKTLQHEADLFINHLKDYYTHMSQMQIRIFFPYHTQSFEIYSINGNPWQTQTPRSNLHLPSHQVPILLERNEQGFPEIHS